MAAISEEEIYTIDDIYSLPERERAELIDGQIFYMAPRLRITRGWLIILIRR